MQNLETEEALLFCVLNKPECIEDIRRWIPEENVFYNSFNKKVWLECSKLYNNNEPVATTPVVSALSVTIDMEDRIQSANDVVSGIGTKTVAFTNAFKTVNYAVGVTGQGMATGDYFLVENKTINGFDVTFKNSSNTVISRTFDFIAKGF